MGDEGKDEYTDYMAWESLFSGILKARMLLLNSRSNSTSTSSSTSTHNNNNSNVPLIPDEKKKGICRDTVKPLSKFSHNRMNREIGGPSCYYCVICGDAKPFSSPTVRGPCTHRYCLDCFQAYVAGKIQENASPMLDCPETNCNKKLSLHFWLEYVPEEVYRRKKLAYLESMCLASPRTIKCPYCCFRFVDDKRSFLIRACTNCWSVICTTCMDRWHMGLSCGEYQTRRLWRVRFGFN